MTPGIGWGHNGGDFFTCRIIFKNLLRNHLDRKFQSCMEVSGHSPESSLLKSWMQGSDGATIVKLFFTIHVFI
jgi:hypothetical protein